MAEAAIEKQIRGLREELNRHNHLYYQQARPEISDQEYDALMRELIALEQAHPELLTGDSPSQRVGGEPIEGFATVEHAVRMYSIDNTYDEEELRKFDERVRKVLGGEEVEYVCEPKVDGVACSLRYEDGLLVLAATRGDGRRGDDVTHNVRTIRAVPLRFNAGKGNVPEVVEVRGEIYMPTEEFQRINKRLVEQGDEPLKNPRNATAGTLKQLDPKVTASRKLKFIAHGAGEVRPMPVQQYWDWVKLIEQWGLPVGEDVQLCKGIDAVVKHVEKFATVRGKLAYQTDGMVIKVNSLEQRERLGFTAKSPRWVIAFKYPAEQVQTILHGVRWQVGKGGTLTPVADLEPVFVGGSTVSRATLHNIEQIDRLDIHLGDTVVVEKAGEVIPYVSAAVTEKRSRGAKKVHAPTHCPSCGTKVEKEEGTPILRCPNPECPAQLRERLKWFVGRRQMDIEGLGEKILDQLMDKGTVKTFADLFRLTVPEIADLTREVKREDKTVLARIGEKNAEKIVASADEAKERGLARVLAGLGIPHVGATIAEEVAEAFGDLDVLTKASEGEIRAALAEGENAETREEETAAGAEKLHELLHASLMGKQLAEEMIALAEQEGGYAKIKEMLAKEKVKIGKPEMVNLLERYTDADSLWSASAAALADAMIGRVVAHSLYEWLHSPEGKRITGDLCAAGVKFHTQHRHAAAIPAGAHAEAFAGKTFVITGGFENFSRDELRDKVKALGGKTSESVSKKTDVLLCGTDAGSKLDKAKSLGIAIWEEPELLTKLGEGN
ncbi:MAG TPA: NAD-dependent DNA ligase LigA [Tepidisphaeraceae bacterium]|jgi:DNA ligase (NAD+)|nr:NAD-dependent DNA ligase LigA [Tepidisphaeraceae bacterium]